MRAELMRTEMLDKAGQIAAKATVGAGAVSAVWGWLTVERIFSALGVLIGVGGLLITWYYKRRADRRSQSATALHEEFMRARIELLRSGAAPGALRVDTDFGLLPDGVQEADE